ncbi:sulfurtransferase [Klebsiella michiganensis]|nr:sulfurtransferase [Klebsiella michiganensis]
MSSSHLLSAQELLAAQQQGINLKVFDCSYDLNNPEYGILQYVDAHIPGAVYADLGHALSSSSSDASSGGRHPLPSRDSVVRWLEQMGLNNDSLVVVYDRNNSSFCVRLWWMLRWIGHENVKVLNGGFQAWCEQGYCLESGEGDISAGSVRTLRFQQPLTKLVNAEYVLLHLNDPTLTIIDARAAERYRGETEPLDPFAGHIPGALNRPFSDNLQADGTFKPAHVLRQEFASLLKDKSADHVVCYCGSGVTATLNILALELAGLGSASLYGGSWSDWSRRTDYPKEKSLRREKN